MFLHLHALLMAILLLTGCSDPPERALGSIVVGLTSELQLGVDLAELHVVLRADGEILREHRFTSAGPGPVLPAELRFDELESGTRVEVEIEAFRPADDRQPLLVRSAVTEVLASKTLLLRVRLERACVIPPGGERCGDGATCVGGTCVDPRVDPATLEDYAPSWSTGASDACKPASGGAPEVIVGKGQGDYLPLADLEELQVEAGPQGGHHIWIAIRVKNLRRAGSITSVRGHVPELNHDIRPFNVIFSLDPEEGGYCSLHGLRFQVDSDISIQELLGKVVNVSVSVTDADGAVGVGERQVRLAQTIL
ncbi:hypothetical protein [Chondromyces crocatus]|uniref:Uncharacterized protein n=1 Tax=Chondromyces crocatus TaxID=52 RepID=A0A0K1EQA9_CHOCO|nr:hypothetical protein [Chondromyces crocatus]AKT42808.1 uncharacterized protein CMC5_070350 [Chondromyces crocatus]